MHNIYNLIVGQKNEQLQEKAESGATFQAVNTDQYQIGYLIILNILCFSNNSKKQQTPSLCLATRRLYNTMQYSNKNTTDYLLSFCNIQKVNEVCNGSLIEKGVQKHRTKILYPLYNNVFDYQKEYDKKDAVKAGEEILCAILYLENSDKSRFSNLKKRVENDYVIKKSE